MYHFFEFIGDICSAFETSLLLLLHEFVTFMFWRNIFAKKDDHAQSSVEFNTKMFISVV